MAPPWAPLATPWRGHGTAMTMPFHAMSLLMGFHELPWAFMVQCHDGPLANFIMVTALSLHLA